MVSSCGGCGAAGSAPCSGAQPACPGAAARNGPGNAPRVAGSRRNSQRSRRSRARRVQLDPQQVTQPSAQHTTRRHALPRRPKGARCRRPQSRQLATKGAPLPERAQPRPVAVTRVTTWPRIPIVGWVGGFRRAAGGRRRGGDCQAQRRRARAALRIPTASSARSGELSSAACSAGLDGPQCALSSP